MHGSAAAARVHIRADDPSLTGHAGLLLTGELIRRTGLVERIDKAVNAAAAFKLRRRGVGAGELLVSLAETMLCGGDHLAHLGVLRSDTAGARLRAVSAPPPPTTAGQLLRRLTAAQCRAALAATAAVGNAVDTFLGLDPSEAVTLDLDATTTEVYGRKKQGAAFNYEGRRSYSSHLITWAERCRTLASDLLAGNAAATPGGPALLRRALRALPEGHGPVRLRGDSDYYAINLLHACRRAKVGFAVSVPRSTAMWRALDGIDPQAWQPAIGMPGAEVAETAYRPQDWKHEPLRLLVRRVPIDADEISSSPRARRRRTIPALQLALALSGGLERVHGYSFILTDLPGAAVDVELWQRQRAHIEERIKDLKLGCGLFHLPLGKFRANRGWQVAAVIAANVAAMLSAVLVCERGRRWFEALADGDLAGDQAPRDDDVPGPADEPSYRVTKTLRRWMIAIPGRVVRAAGRRLDLRLPLGLPWADDFIAVYERIRLIPLVT